jgi:hypothetical protein
MKVLCHGLHLKTVLAVLIVVVSWVAKDGFASASSLASLR